MKIVITFIGLLIIYPSWAGSLYKCKSQDGSIAFQGIPCENNQATLSKKETASYLDKSKLSRKEKYVFETFVLYKQSKAALSVCKGKRVSSARDLENKLDRYAKIAKFNIDSGRKLSEAGTVNTTSKTFNSYVDKKIRSSVSSMKKMDSKKVKYLCSGIASKLAVAASQTSNRASGYYEGDLDSEGND